MEDWGLAHWTDAGGGGRVHEEAVAEMRAHPRFPEAMRRVISGSLELVESDPIMMRAIKNMNRQASGILALYLDASGGLTLARIQQLLVDLGLMSPGRAVAMLAQLRMLRYVELAAEQPDRRKRLYTPTPAMRRAFFKQFRNDLSAFAVIEPEAQEVIARLDEPEVARKFIIQFGERFKVIIDGYEQRLGESALFLQRQAGLMILNALVLAGDERDDFPPSGQIRFSIAGLARRCGVSRPHVRKLLRDAERLGLLRRGDEEGCGVLEATLRDGVINYHASSFVSYAAYAQAALSSSEIKHQPADQWAAFREQ